VRAAWTEVGTRESDDVEVTDSVSLTTDSHKPRFTHVVIRGGLTGGDTGTAFVGGDY
jgi:hypothetical protein